MSYSSIIQKDLPLISWSLDDSTLTAGSTAATDGFFGGYDGQTPLYTGSYVTACTAKEVPIIFGSSQSVIITHATAGTTVFRVPSLDRMSSKFVDEPSTLEFWLKFINPSFAAPTTMTKIVGKPNSQTGVYIHNSSFIGVVGDTAGNIVRVSVPVDDITKTFHVALVYNKTSVSLSVNGTFVSKSIELNTLNKAYSSGDEYFNFVMPAANLDYALDHISIYSRALTVQECRKHFVYGIGYEISNQVANSFGGVRYNMSMAQSEVIGSYQKGSDSTWKDSIEIDNLDIKNGMLVPVNAQEPKLKYAKDKESSVFTWGAYGVSCAAGGYIELENVKSIVNTASFGYAAVFDRATGSAINGTMTLAYFNDPYDQERYIKFYITGNGTREDLYYQRDDRSATILLSNTSGSINGEFSCGFFYNATTSTITTYAGKASGGSGNGTASDTSVTSLVLDDIRIGSMPVYSEFDNYADIVSGEDERFTGGLKNIISLPSALTLPPTPTLSNIHTAIKTAPSTDYRTRYFAEADITNKRFIIKSVGKYEFVVDLKQLCGNASIVGTNKVEWGYDGQEVSISMTGIEDSAGSQSTWLASASIINGSNLTGIYNVSPGTSKYLKFTVNFVSNDVVENPTKLMYFRITAYRTTEPTTGTYKMTLVNDGPDIDIYATSSKNAVILPSTIETPFLYDNEQGGLFIPYYAQIDYDYQTITSDSTTGIYGLSMFVNIPSGADRYLFSVVSSDAISTKLYELKYTSSSTSLSLSTGTGTIYINGSSASSTITPGRWQHVVVVFSTQVQVTASKYPVIILGSKTQTSSFYIDELMTFDQPSITSNEIGYINKIYKGTNTVQVGKGTYVNASDKAFAIYDSEIGTTQLYQPLSGQTSVASSVNFASTKAFPYTLSGTTGNLTFTPTNLQTLVLDGTIIDAGDRILLKNETGTTSRNGIFTVGAVAKNVSVTLTRVSAPVGTLVYVKEGLQNEGAYYYHSSTDVWTKTYVLDKIVSYSSPKSGIFVSNTSFIED